MSHRARASQTGAVGAWTLGMRKSQAQYRLHTCPAHVLFLRRCVCVCLCVRNLLVHGGMALLPTFYLFYFAGVAAGPRVCHQRRHFRFKQLETSNCVPANIPKPSHMCHPTFQCFSLVPCIPKCVCVCAERQFNPDFKQRGWLPTQVPAQRRGLCVALI